MKAIAWIFGISALIFVAVYLSKDKIRDFLFPNTINLKTYGEANQSLVDIKWTSEGNSDTLLVYSDGSQTLEEFRAKGYNYFMLYYKDELLGTFDQFKNIANTGNEYEFMLWQLEDSVQTDLKIIGPDAK